MLVFYAVLYVVLSEFKIFMESIYHIFCGKVKKKLHNRNIYLQKHNINWQKSGAAGKRVICTFHI